MKQTQPVRVRIGAFALDLRSGELCANDQRTILREQPLQILRMLVEREGGLVSREEIRKKLWPNDTIVEFDHSINAAIKNLRRALGDSADEPKYIETLARRGYRLMVPVERVSAGDSSSAGPVGIGGAAVRQQHEPSLIGKKVSHYRVLEVIGAGGMGLVYGAEDLKLGRPVALKFLPEELRSDPAALKRFEREAQTASSLNHPNICTIYEVEEHEDKPFIVMELLEGETMRERLTANASKPIPLGELLDIAVQTCSGLGAAHRKGIIHRDIKPANIFLTRPLANVAPGEREDIAVKILDFGLAKLVSKEIRADGRQGDRDGTAGARQLARPVPLDVGLTRLGDALGTAGYMSPEQIRGETLDARSDIFSLGLVLYEMATGKRAFSGDDPVSIQAAILSVSPLTVREQNPDIPPELEGAINKALDKDRAQRYQSAAELRSELQRLRRGMDAGGPVEDERKQRWPLWLGGSVVALLAILLVVRLGWFRAAPSPELKEQQLTANPIDDPVTGGAISPDGKYVAYHDQTGLYLRYLDTGETHPIALPAELRGRIDSLCWIPGAGKLVADVRSSDGFDIWIITAFGKEDPRLLYRHGKRPAIAPDGRSIAFLGYDPGNAQRTVWVGSVYGEAPRKVVEGGELQTEYSPTWSPDGQWIAYGKHWRTGGNSWSSAIEEVPAHGGSPKTLVAESSLPQTCTFVIGAVDGAVFTQRWSPDWRLIFSVTELSDPSYSRSRYGLWKIQADPQTAELTGKPEPMTPWSDFGFANLTITEDGKKLSFVKDKSWADVYLAEPSPDATTMTAPRRFTLDDRGSEQAVWTHDSQAVLFDSKRNGKQEIFRQALDENVAQVVISSPRNVSGVDSSPDGKWFIYWESDSHSAGSSVHVDVRAYRTLMRRPVAGGSPEELFDQPKMMPLGGAFYCASSPKAVVPCALGLQEGKELVFYELDPVRGQGNRLGAIQVPNLMSAVSWSVSPDGSRVALVDEDTYGGRIEILNLLDGTRSEVALDPGAGSLESISWTADGSGFFLTSLIGGSSTLAHVSGSGKLQPLLSSQGLRQFASSPLPSPDGKYLAFQAQTRDSNLWMIDKF